MMFTIRRLRPDEGEAYRAIRLRALQDAPDAFGSTLALEQTRPLENWTARLEQAASSGIDCPLAAEADGELVGLAWAKVDAVDAGLVNLYQMWMAPQWRGQGVAGTLLRAAIAWAGARGARAVELGVNCANPAAIGLYARAGFVTVSSPYPMREGTTLMEQRMRLTL
ncbi:MAG: GNAT family N-acetyltransferase [Telluria sp.]